MVVQGQVNRTVSRPKSWTCVDIPKAESVATCPPEDVFIVGAGGIGCAVGHALRAGDLDVTFVEADLEKVAWGTRNGVGLGRHSFLPANFIPFEPWHPPPRSLVLLCTKCF